MSTDFIKKLDSLPPLNWDNFEETSLITKELLNELAADKRTLRILVDQVIHNPQLLNNSECHELLERIDIYDASERNFRIRLNFTTPVTSIRPHDHRYSFSTKILSGSYQHFWFTTTQDIYEKGSNRPLKDFIDKNNPDKSSSIEINQMTPLFVTNQTRNSEYSIHHSVIHGVVTTPNTISLMIRGPAEKERSIIADRSTNKIWWRFGREDESSERIQSKKMSKEYYTVLKNRLISTGIIAN